MAKTMLLKLMTSPLLPLLVFYMGVYFFAYKKGAEDTLDQVKEQDFKFAVEAMEKTLLLQKSYNQLADQVVQLRKERKQKTQTIEKEVIKYVETKAPDSPCFIDLDAVGMLDQLCEVSGSCANTSNSAVPAIPQAERLQQSG